MMTVNPIEIVGLFATLMVTTSYISSKLSVVRIVNIVGSIAFIIYGAVLGAHSVWITNSVCLIINVYKLYKEGVIFKNFNKNQK